MHRFAALLVWGVATSATAGSRTAPPAPPASDDADAEVPPRETLERVGELFRRGQDRFDTSDYTGAIELWTQAYEVLPDTSAVAGTRAMLLLGIAQAHVEAHAIDGSIDHLRRADVLFDQYLATIDPDDAQTREEIEQRRRAIAEVVERHEAEQAEDEARRRAALEADGPPPVRPRPRDEEADDGFVPYTKWERAMLIGGGVTIAFGIGLTGAMGSFLWLRDEEVADGREEARDAATSAGDLRDRRLDARRFNRLAISTGASAAVLGVVGLGVVVAAHVHRNRRRDRPRVAASVSPNAVVLGLGGRF